MFPPDIQEKLKSLRIVLASSSTIRENLLKRLVSLEILIFREDQIIDF